MSISPPDLFGTDTLSYNKSTHEKWSQFDIVGKGFGTSSGPVSVSIKNSNHAWKVGSNHEPERQPP